ncbi:poly-gamma-glutamate hydrolase family protein [Vreelandella neptunia]|uniref:Poly-gamma-glutamate hydrolase family protein n=1 Tax=Vreelandella neptunia TaxID=115551 RepID=A0ABZ0YI28_9GAMM|nr:poly-gamma-glutamate hydrolase family protein [Halomonas neptunia]MDN3562409.1 poly-gamma-glutamate hydrolase family protein [Halomonas neptunia]WQH11761.1 poly-gamma-glutamate hydrolase family protein [Halomonas neptunia]
MAAKIEPGASSLAKRIPGNTFNYYNFNGQKRRHNWYLHSTSTEFDEPIALAFASGSTVAVTLYGCMGRGAIAYNRGDNVELRHQLEIKLKRTGMKSRPHPMFHGCGRHNICNRGQRDLQLELTPRLRLCPFAWGKRRVFIDRVRKVLGDDDNLDS